MGGWVVFAVFAIRIPRSAINIQQSYSSGTATGLTVQQRRRNIG